MVSFYFDLGGIELTTDYGQRKQKQREKEELRIYCGWMLLHNCQV